MNFIEKENKKFMQIGYLRRKYRQLFVRPLIGNLIRKIYNNKIKFYGISIVTTDTIWQDIEVAALYFKTYEEIEVYLIKKYILPNSTIIELGASLGVISSLLINAQNKNSNLICIEANSICLNSIEQNLQFNANNKKYKILNKAVWYKDGYITFKYDNVNYSHIDFENNTEKSDKNSIEAISLNSVFSTLDNLELNQKLVLVMDIEGTEIPLLLNDKSSINKFNAILVELHSIVYENKKWKIDEISNLLIEMDFKLIEIIYRNNDLAVAYFEKN